VTISLDLSDGAGNHKKFTRSAKLQLLKRHA
jgi:hypothetical protein